MERKVNESGGRVQMLIGGEKSGGWIEILTGDIDGIEDHDRKNETGDGGYVSVWRNEG